MHRSFVTAKRKVSKHLTTGASCQLTILLHVLQYQTKHNKHKTLLCSKVLSYAVRRSFPQSFHQPFNEDIIQELQCIFDLENHSFCNQ